MQGMINYKCNITITPFTLHRKTGFEFIDDGDIDVSAVLSLLGQDVWFKNTEYERSGKVIHIICFRQDI